MKRSNMSWSVGTASSVFTPDEPVWLAGYAARTEPAKGTISDLRARALALRDDATGARVLILTLDLIAAGPLVTAGVLQHLHQRHGLEKRSVLIAASHTHYGPEIRPDKALFFHIPEPYVKKILESATRVRQALIDVADRALADLKPARLFARRTTAGFAHNRRRQGVKGGNPSPQDTLDHDVPVLEVVDASTQQRRAIV